MEAMFLLCIIIPTAGLFSTVQDMKRVSTKMSHVVADKYLLDKDNKWFGASFMEMTLSRSFDRWLFLFLNSGENCLAFVQGQTAVLKTPLFTEFMCWEYL